MAANRETKTHPIPTSEAKGLLPTVNVFWIGEPTRPGVPDVIPGHDTVGIELLMDANDDKNPFAFWCLRKHRGHYQKRFAARIEQKRLEIKCIEDVLEQDFPDPDAEALKKEVNKIINFCLYNPKHGSIRDKAFVKDIFIVTFLMLFDGWVLDSNIVPMEGEKVYFPHLDSFHIPHNPPEVESRIDLWMMYSPASSRATVRAILSNCLKYWKTHNLETLPPDTLRYSLELGSVMIYPIENALNEQKIKKWDYVWHPANYCPLIKNLKIMKIHLSTHIHDRSPRVNFRNLPAVLKAVSIGHPGWLRGILNEGADASNKALVPVSWHHIEAGDDAFTLAGKYSDHACLLILLEAKAPAFESKSGDVPSRDLYQFQYTRDGIRGAINALSSSDINNKEKLVQLLKCYNLLPEKRNFIGRMFSVYEKVDKKLAVEKLLQVLETDQPVEFNCYMLGAFIDSSLLGDSLLKKIIAKFLHTPVLAVLKKVIDLHFESKNGTYVLYDPLELKNKTVVVKGIGKSCMGAPLQSKLLNFAS